MKSPHQGDPLFYAACCGCRLLGWEARAGFPVCPVPAQANSDVLQVGNTSAY